MVPPNDRQHSTTITRDSIETLKQRARRLCGNARTHARNASLGRARCVPCDALSHGVSEYVEGGWLMPGT
jgi:hypothetical protein